MFHPVAFTSGLLLLINICSLSSSAKNTSKNTSDIPTDYEWGSIEEIDTAGKNKLEQKLHTDICLVETAWKSISSNILDIGVVWYGVPKKLKTKFQSVGLPKYALASIAKEIEIFTVKVQF